MKNYSTSKEANQSRHTSRALTSRLFKGDRARVELDSGHLEEVTPHATSEY